MAVKEIGQYGEAHAVVMDVCDEGSVSRGIAEVEERFGRIDALINNAALFTQLQRKPLVEIGLAE